VNKSRDVMRLRRRRRS